MSERLFRRPLWTAAVPLRWPVVVCPLTYVVVQRRPVGCPTCGNGRRRTWVDGGETAWQCGGQGFESPQLHPRDLHGCVERPGPIASPHYPCDARWEGHWEGLATTARQPGDRSGHQRGRGPGSAERRCGSDRLAAMRCAGLIARLAAEGRPVDRSGAAVVVEVYPAAALRHWACRFAATRAPWNAGVRDELVDQLAAAAPGMRFGARAAALGRVTGPGVEQAAAARTEGWIALPTGGLADLNHDLPGRVQPTVLARSPRCSLGANARSGTWTRERHSTACWRPVR